MQESLLQGQTRLLEMVAFCSPLEETLAAALRFCESHSEDMLTSILLLDADGKRLRHGAAPSLPPEYMRQIDGRAIGPRAGSCGTAAFLGEPVIVEDIAADPLWPDYKESALAFGLRACWSTPIFDHDHKVLGTFAMYYRRPCGPKDLHHQLIAFVTYIAGIAIMAQRMKKEKYEVFERISDAFVALDNQGRVIYVNAKAGQFLGREPDNLIGKDMWAEFPQAIGGVLHAAIGKAMREQQPLVIEQYIPPKDLWFEKRIYPSPEGVSVYYHDITDRKREEDRARQTEKMTAIGQLASGVAHDFNNQLSIMLGYAGLLENRINDAELKRYAAAIVRAADRSGDLTRSLLAFSRPGDFETVSVDLHELIGEVAELMAHSIDRRIAIGKRLNAKEARVMGDPATLQNALLNLALNARDAMPEGGRLDFTTESEGDWLHLAVTDTGSGMSEAVRARIFEPFFTTKPPGKGTGMGLASVFGTVKAHQGRIEAESAPGRGTTFHVRLPVAARPRARKPESAPPRAPRNLCILVVDDEPHIREMVGDMLRPGGHTVLHAAGGREAAELYRERWRGIDLIILDMVMADSDGPRTFRELRAINPAAKVILSSGYSPEGKIQPLLEEGAQGLLPKPYSKAQLEESIAVAMIEADRGIRTG